MDEKAFVDHEQRIQMLEHRLASVRVIRPRANVTGGRPQCVYEHDPDDCPVASVDIYQAGCRGDSCHDESSAYYAIYRDNQKLRDQVKRKAEKVKAERKRPVATEVPVPEPKRRAAPKPAVKKDSPAAQSRPTKKLLGTKRVK